MDFDLDGAEEHVSPELERVNAIYERARAAIDALNRWERPAQGRTLTPDPSPVRGRGEEREPSQAEQPEEVGDVGGETNGQVISEEDRRPGAVFGDQVWRWEKSTTHGELAERLQGRKGEGCRLVARSLVRRPLEPTPGLWHGNAPEAGVRSVWVAFADGYEVVASRWAVERRKAVAA
jgi:hypothetical protein